MNTESFPDLLICASFKKNAYRITNKANTTPITTITHAPTVPPTVTGKLFDEEKDAMLVSRQKK